MVDMLALSIAHGLLVLAALRLVMRDDLDREGETRRPFGLRRRPGSATGAGEQGTSEAP